MHHTPELQREQEKQERIMRIKKLAEKGVNPQQIPTILHGTTLEGLKHIIQKGTLPGSSVDVRDDYKKGSLSVVLLEKTDDISHCVEMVEDYARLRSVDHEIMHRYGIHISDENTQDLIASATQYFSGSLSNNAIKADVDKLIEHLQTTEETLHQVYTEVVEKNKGVVISINSDFLNTCKHNTNAEELHEIILYLSDTSLTLDTITGIQAIGEAEKEFIANL